MPVPAQVGKSHCGQLPASRQEANYICLSPLVGNLTNLILRSFAETMLLQANSRAHIPGFYVMQIHENPVLYMKLKEDPDDLLYTGAFRGFLQVINSYKKFKMTSGVQK